MTPTIQAKQLFEQAMGACRSGDRARGVQLFNRAIRADANNPALHTHSAGALMSFGQMEAARDILLAAVNVFPTNAAILNDLAGVLFTMGRPDEAVDRWRQSVEHAPSGFVSPLYNLANVLQRRGQADEAEA